MAEVRKKLTKMSSADPKYISLVKRGANGIPFRITKSNQGEDDMPNIDLSKGFWTRKSADNKPTVLALVVEKTDDMEAVKKALTDAGFSVEKADEQDDDTVVFAQVDGEIKGDVVRVSENLVAVVKHVDTDGLAAVKVEGVEGYFPGLDIVKKSVADTIAKALEAGDGEAVQKAGEGLQMYKNAWGTIPEAVLKADTALGEVAKAAADKAEADRVAKEAADAEAERVAAEAKKNEGKTPEEIEAERVEAQRLADEAANSVAGQIAKALEGLNIGEQITKALQPLADQIGALDAKVKEVATKADTVEKTVKGTVAAGAPAGDEDAGRTRTTKQDVDADQRTGCFDTAMIRKSAGSRH